MKWLYTVLEGVSLRLGSVTCALYALLYLVAIPLFAILYSLMPYQFYHATSHYEASLLEDRLDIAQGVLSTIVSGRNRQDAGPSVTWEDWSIDIWENYIPELHIGEDTPDFYQISMKPYLSLSPTGSTNKLSDMTLYPRLTVWVANLSIFITGNADVLITDIESDHLQVDEDRRLALTKALFGSRCLGVWNGKVRVQLPSKTPDRIRAYIKAKRGFPSEAHGNYWRMLYFSSVTITTLGYGDIVPISTRARLCVSLESILGIVLIGLFLNSLSFTFRRERLDSKGN